MPATPTPKATPLRPCRRRRVARWWLAGLLVSCLLPVNLHAPEIARHFGRCAYAAIRAPAMLRARSRRLGRRMALGRRAFRLKRHGRHERRRERFHPAGLVAALDVISRRGPPAAVRYLN